MNSKLNGLRCLACDKYGQKLHRVPKDKLRLKKWLLLLGKEKLMEVDDKNMQNNGKVCGDHFEDWAFSGTTKSHLIKFAYPILKNPPLTFLHSNQHRTCDNLDKVPIFHEPFLPNPFYRPSPIAHLITCKVLTSSQVTSNEQSTGSSNAPSFSSTPKTSATLRIITNQQSTAPKRSPTLQFIRNQQTTGTLNAPSIPKRPSLPQVISNQQATRLPTVRPKKSPEWQMVLNQRSEISRLKKKIEKLKNPSFLDKLKDKMTEDQYDFFMSQIKQAGKEGRRWLKKDVEFALRIYKQSPSAYEILKQRLLLPSKATLKRTLRQNPDIYKSDKPSSPLKKSRKPKSKQTKLSKT